MVMVYQDVCLGIVVRAGMTHTGKSQFYLLHEDPMMMSACQNEHLQETSQEPQLSHLPEDSLMMSASRNDDLLDISQEPPGAESLSSKKRHYFSVYQPHFLFFLHIQREY